MIIFLLKNSRFVFFIFIFVEIIKYMNMSKNKVLALAIVMITVNGVFAQNYSIMGKTPAVLNGKKVYLVELESGKYQPLDSAMVENGTFTMDGKTETAAQFCSLTFMNRQIPSVSLILEKTPLTITFGSDNQVASFTGSSLNERFFASSRQVEEISKQQKELSLQWRKLQRDNNGKVPETEGKVIDEKYDSLDNVKNNLVYNICMKNTDNVIPAYFLRVSRDGLGLEKTETILAQKGEFQNHPFTKKVAEAVAKEKKTAIGCQFTDFSMEDVNGSIHKLSDYAGKGKYVFVDFWASWCGPCRAEIPNVKKAYEQYSSKGLEIVGISLDNKAEAWKSALTSMGMTWKQLSDLKGWNSLGADLYSIHSIPATVLIDPQGKIIARNLRGEEMLSKFAEIFK